MNFNKHSSVEGRHAFLSPSNHAWTNYNEDKLEKAYFTHLAVIRGTDLHTFASEAIRLGIRMKNSKETLNKYINDAIGFRMSPEQPLWFSENCFGTADAICFDKDLLRIHDLKTGVHKASFRQLEVYAAIFCLEYLKDPFEIKIELRIYQNDEVRIMVPDPSDIVFIMDRIKSFDNLIRKIREEVE